MNITTEKLNNFIEMMQDVARSHSCTIDIVPKDYAPNTMEVIISKRFFTKHYAFMWSNVKSLTQIATDIWSMFFNDYYNNPMFKYVNTDVSTTMAVAKQVRNCNSMTIRDVKFNGPATIVFWADGTKTVVKCQEGDVFDPEKGLAMAIAKKALGNKGNYCNEIKKWTEGYCEPLYPRFVIDDSTIKNVNKEANRFYDILEKRVKRVLEGKGFSF